MKRQILLLSTLLVGFIGQAQQLGQYSQYVNNSFMLNPAAAGEHDYLDIDLSYRQQWVGIDNAPQNYYLSAHTTIGGAKEPFFNPSLRTSSEIEAVTIGNAPKPTKGLKHAIGGLIAADNYGPFRRMNANAAYSIHLPVSQTAYLSFGANLGWAGMNFDQNFIQLSTASDGVYDQFSANSQKLNLFDLNLGVYAYSSKFFAGYSTNQLLQNKIYFGGTPLDGKQHVHHFIQGGVNIGLSDKLMLTPSTLIKYMNPAPISFDINAKVTYDESYFAGLAYRYGDAIGVLIGAYINNKIKFAYSYDYTTSSLGEFNTGGHEIMFGLMLNKK